jgi:sortase A
MTKAIRIFSGFVLIAGMCLTGRALYLDAKAGVAGILIRRAWAQNVQSGETQRPWPWADTHPVARIEIPRLGYDEIVLEGATGRTLAFGPARITNGAGLGEPGNLLLAGHRTSWFLPLKDIAAGDMIRIQWFDARHRELVERSYTVNTIRVVDPSDTTLLAPTSQDALTLITCYPFGSSPYSPQRFVVRASPVGTSRFARADEKPEQIANRQNDLRVPLRTIW